MADLIAICAMTLSKWCSIKQNKRKKIGELQLTPLAWGNQQAEVIVLGFSKGSTQSGALENTPHDKIAYIR
jgi:hypothetical protein